MKGRQEGFTLVELMITLVLSSLIATVIFAAYTTQQKTYLNQNQVVEMQQNIRAAMHIMTNDIRMAGYDPLGTANAGITIATESQLRISMDLTDDGDVADAGEDIKYGFSDANDSNDDGVPDAGRAPLGRVSGPVSQDVAENVNRVEFYYTLKDGSKSLTPLNVKKISAVQVTLLLQAGQADKDLTNNTIYNSPGGKVWGPFGDGFRRRMLTRTIQCRNLGL